MSIEQFIHKFSLPYNCKCGNRKLHKMEIRLCLLYCRKCDRRYYINTDGKILPYNLEEMRNNSESNED